MKPQTLVIICQVYPPDPTAVGQHVADVAEGLRAQGWRVVVFAASRDYENPSVRYESVRGSDGVEVRRLPFSSFGKTSIAVRLLAQMLFLTQATVWTLFSRKLDAILVSTSPPFAGLAGAILKGCRHATLTWWVMDLNPDQMIRFGRISQNGLAARIFDWINRATLRAADHVVVLDQYMQRAMTAKGGPAGDLRIIPPWAPGDFAAHSASEPNQWRMQHVPEGRRVVMYSGNHGFANPLETLLDAAEAAGESKQRLFFMFVGGGTRKREVEQRIAKWPAGEALALPYQPLAILPQSLSSADVHVVSVATEAVGVSHSCKIYGALALGRPILAIAPRESHVADIVTEYDCGWVIAHGDVAAMKSALSEIASLPLDELGNKGLRGFQLVQDKYARRQLILDVCAVVADGARGDQHGRS